MATYKYLTECGTIVPDTAAIKTEVETEFMEVFGLTEVPDASSNEGRMIDAEVTSRVSVARNNALLANQQNPNLANGTFLDSHLVLFGGERDASESSTVDCLLTGVPGTLIPVGSVAQDEDRNSWLSTADATLDGTGQATVTFSALESGPITADPNTITKINTGVVGWETITNPADAVPGKTEQNDIRARRQRRRELGGNSRSNVYSVLAAVSAIDGVAGVRFRENFEGTTEVVDNVTMKPHSTWICVDGGVTTGIIDAYYTSRTGGSGFNSGATATPVTQAYNDPDSGQSILVEFDRPDDLPLICRITARISQGVSGVDDIKDAVVAYASGELDGELGFYLGEDASPFEIAAGVNQVLSGVFVGKCELATKAAGETGYSTDTIPTEIYQKASIIKGDIEVVLL